MQIVVVTSKIIEPLRGDLAASHDAGAINKITMRQFDTICAPPMREFSADGIKRLREALHFTSLHRLDQADIPPEHFVDKLSDFHAPFDRARS